MDPDWVECGSLIGELDGRLVAHAAFMRLRETGAAEVAFTVADEHQGRGIGPRLLERLAERAAEAGIERFVAEVLADNRPMLKVFEEAGFEISRTLEGSEVEVSFPIAPTARYLDRIDRRDHLAAAASLRPFFAPSSVAVLGASRRRDSIGGRLFRNIVEAEFTGVVYPVNRAGEAVAGVRGYSSVSELPETPDLVVVCLPGAIRALNSRGGTRPRNEGDLCDLRRLRRGRRGGEEASGSPAGARPRPTAAGSSAPIVWESRSPPRA